MIDDELVQLPHGMRGDPFLYRASLFGIMHLMKVRDGRDPKKRPGYVLRVKLSQPKLLELSFGCE